MQNNSPYPVSDKKNSFSNFVFHTFSSKHKKDFKSESFVEATDYRRKQSKRNIYTQTNFKSHTNVSLTPKKIEIFREIGTQTSKTVVAMVQTELHSRLSPDSLSPKATPKRTSGVHDVVNVHSTDSEITEKEIGNISYNRKNNLVQYLESCDDFQKLTLLSGNSLTKTFLEKKRNRNDHRQYNSILKKSSPKQKNRLKSQSCIETPKEKESFYIKDEKPKPPARMARFAVKGVKEIKSVEEKTKPVKHYCRSKCSESSDTPVKGKRSSFMSPTFASEQRDQSIELKDLGKLISPIKRGRSLSPKKSALVNCENKETQKDVPYFDRSDHSLGSDIGACMEQARDKAEDSGAEDLHLNLSLSIDNITNTIESLNSSTSTECILFQAISKLRDQNWGIALRGLAEIVELCRVLNNDAIFPHMTIINQRLIQLIKCARSHVSRTACQAVGPLFEYVKDTRRPEFDELVNTLLSKTADANKFIRHDANLALDCMVTHIATYHAVRSLSSKGPDHKNPLVRTATARLMVCVIMIAGPEHILHPNNSEYTRKRLILNMVKFVEDKCHETRKYGHKIYKLLYKDRLFDIYLKRYLEREVVVKLKKCLNTPCQ